MRILFVLSLLVLMPVGVLVAGEKGIIKEWLNEISCFYSECFVGEKIVTTTVIRSFDGSFVPSALVDSRDEDGSCYFDIVATPDPKIIEKLKAEIDDYRAAKALGNYGGGANLSNRVALPQLAGKKDKKEQKVD